MAKGTIWDGADSHWDLDVLGVRPWADQPTGITIHYTANGSLDATKNEMKALQGVSASSKGYHVGYHFVIDRKGLVCQTASLGKGVNHAGDASWNGQSPNRSHIAIAFVGWGLLNKDGKTWANTVPDGSVHVDGNDWEPATRLQELSLIRLIKSLMKEYEISALNICGHDECAKPKGRKVDPGGSLSRPLSVLRKELAI